MKILKRIKQISLALITLTTTLALASEEFIKARSVKGYSNYTKLNPTECTFSVEAQNWDGHISAKVYLNTDTDSLINFSIEIPQEDLPLQDGYTAQPFNNVNISYSNGVLKLTEVRDDQGYYGGHIIDTVEIPVSSDLATPHGVAKAQSTYKSLTHPIGKIDQWLECHF